MLKLYKDNNNKNYSLVQIIENSEERLIGTTCQNLYNSIQNIRKGSNKEYDELYLLSYYNCQEIERGYDLEKLADEWVYKHSKNSIKRSNNHDSTVDNIGSYKAGFLKCLELMSEYKYTRNDMIHAYVYGTNDGAEYSSLAEDNYNEEELKELEISMKKSFNQTLNKNNWEVEILEELDVNGKIILKRVKK